MKIAFVFMEKKKKGMKMRKLMKTMNQIFQLKNMKFNFIIPNY